MPTILPPSPVDRRISHPAKSSSQPPPELLRECQQENAAFDRQQAFERQKIVSGIDQHNQTMLAAARFEDWMEPYFSSDWVEKSTPQNEKPLHYRLISAHWRLRPNSDAVSSTNRDQYLLVVGVEPWYEVQGLTAAEVVARNTAPHSERSLWATPGTSLAQPVRDILGPLELKVLSKFLKFYRPLTGFDIRPLEQLSAPDVGFEDLERPVPPAQPTLNDLIAVLTNALKANKSTAS